MINKNNGIASDFDIAVASKKLCELDLQYVFDDVTVNILWFRAMITHGEWQIDRHTHSSFEFHFIVSGACHVVTDTDCFDVHAGNFYLTGPNVFHQQSSFGIEGVIEYSLNCDILTNSINKLTTTNNYTNEFQQLTDAVKRMPCFPQADIFDCGSLFHKALEEAYLQSQGFSSSIKSISQLIIINAFRALLTDYNLNLIIPKKAGIEDYRLNEILRFIHDNLSTPLSNSSIASYMHLSTKQVSRIIKEGLGISTKELVASRKLERSKDMLINTNLPIKQIAVKLGFSSEYYFNQFFKRMEGYAPGTFRKNVNNK